MKLLKYLLLAVIVLISTSCAVSYTKPNLSSLYYQKSKSTDSVEVNIAFNYLNGNKRYNKYAKKANLTFVALSIKNTTDKPITINKDNLYVMNFDNRINTIDSYSIESEMNQGSIIYMLWALLFLNVQNGEKVSTYPIGLPIGAFNTFISYKADSSFKKDIMAKNIINKTIMPNETGYGIIIVPGAYNNSITVGYKNN